MSTMLAPEKGNGTWRAHLDAGNEVRVARARVRRELKSGSRQLLDALDDPSVQTMPVMDLLAFLPGNRRPRHVARGERLTRSDAQAVKIVRRAEMLISPTLPVDALSPARRRRLAEAAATIPHLSDLAGDAEAPITR